MSILAAFCFLNQSAIAESVDWLADGVTAQAIDDPLVGTPRIENHAQQCKIQIIPVGTYSSPTSSCIYRAKSFEFGWVSRYVGGQDKSSLAIRVGADSRFYMINNIDARWWNSSHWQASPDSDDIVFSSNDKIIVFKNVPNLLSEDPYLGEAGYTIEYPTDQFSFDSQGLYLNAVMSSNGRWLVGEASMYGLYRMDLRDGSVRLIMDEKSLGGSYHLSISDDGSSIALSVGISYSNTDTKTHAKLFMVDENCGLKHSRFWKRVSELNLTADFLGCPWKSINDLIEEIDEDVRYRGGFITGITFPRFGQADGVLDLFAYNYNFTHKWYRLTQLSRVKPSGIEYLAMGDSYSSGEGDAVRKADGSTFYLPRTGGIDQCHLSSRSYPFLLRDYYGISSSSMKSIACSGAQVLYDYLPKMDTYYGQHGELERLDEDVRVRNRQEALDNFVPAIVPQIEFVKKYRPRVVTFTGGGNDVGFARILEYCAALHWEEIVLPESLTDCGYAKEGSVLQEMLFDSINTQYFYNKKFINDIKEASPNTRIIIVGYPSFISDDYKTCSLTVNSGFLTQSERSVINNALARMNAMLRRLAYDTSVSYVHIEDSLRGGRMCEGSKYITGVTDAGYGNVVVSGNAQETFHPNALAHQIIAETIYLSDAFEKTTVSDAGDYRPSVNRTTTLATEIINGAKAIAGSLTRISIKPFTFNPGSSVRIFGYSDQVDLGSYEVDSSGQIDVDIDMSAMGVGKHVLVLEGEDDLGGRVRYYQFIDIVEPALAVGGAGEKVPGVVEENSQKGTAGLGVADSIGFAVPPGIKKVAVDGIDGSRTSARVVGESERCSTVPIIGIISVLLCVGAMYGYKKAKLRNKTR